MWPWDPVEPTFWDLALPEGLQALVAPYFVIRRVQALGPNAWLIHGTFGPGDPSRLSEDLFRHLMAAGYVPSLRQVSPDLYELYIAEEPEELRRPSRPWLHLVLFLLTVLTTLMAGAFHTGQDPFRHPLALLSGIPFSFTLLAILGSHEMGHYLMARYHGVRATLPYFIPFPHPLIGTLGAVIRIRSPIPSRNALLDIGAAGPFAGIAVAIPLTLLGIHWSDLVPLHQVRGALQLGEPLLFRLLVWGVKGPLPPDTTLFLHPVAFAGWLGFFVTALNLLPSGQLDGGHIAYALFGPLHRTISRVTFLALVLLGFLWLGWWTWAFLILVFIRFDHPAPLNQVSRLDPRRRWIGYLAMLLFLLTFVPVPISAG